MWKESVLDDSDYKGKEVEAIEVLLRFLNEHKAKNFVILQQHNLDETDGNNFYCDFLYND